MAGRLKKSCSPGQPGGATSSRLINSLAIRDTVRNLHMRHSLNIFFALLFWVVVCGAASAEPIAIIEPPTGATVSFRRQILPLLERNCLACHNSRTAEADLVLQTPADIRRGGASGPTVVPGQGADSLLVAAAAHAADPAMPPADNKVGAQALSSEQLGWLKHWIDRGAEDDLPDVASATERRLKIPASTFAGDGKSDIGHRRDARR